MHVPAFSGVFLLLKDRWNSKFYGVPAAARLIGPIQPVIFVEPIRIDCLPLTNRVHHVWTYDVWTWVQRGSLLLLQLSSFFRCCFDKLWYLRPSRRSALELLKSSFFFLASDTFFESFNTLNANSIYSNNYISYFKCCLHSFFFLSLQL